jgi:hypothetical protein
MQVGMWELGFIELIIKPNRAEQHLQILILSVRGLRTP